MCTGDRTVFQDKRAVLLKVHGRCLICPWLQMIPVIGWQIAAYRLILLGPTVLNVICTVLYLGVVAVSCRRCAAHEMRRRIL